MKIQNIAVATDFSETANSAVKQAAKLAAKYRAKLTLVHARVLYEDDPSRLPEKMKKLKSQTDRIEADLLERLQNHDGTGDHEDIHCEVIRGYSAPSALLNYFSDQNFDLIVIGTHGRTGIGHFLIGSVVEKIVRYAKSPVLTIHKEMALQDTFSRILVPFDFSGHAEHAFRTALQLADKDHAQIDLLYVVDKDVHPALYSWGMKSIFEIIPDIREKAGKRMDEYIAKADNPAGATVNKHIVEGVPSKEIARLAKETKPDLLVIATHGLVGLDRFLLGSTTEKVIRSVKVPIMTLKLKK